MSITHLKEKLIQDLSVFNSSSSPQRIQVRNRVLSKLDQFESDKKDRVEEQPASSSKTEKKSNRLEEVSKSTLHSSQIYGLEDENNFVLESQVSQASIGQRSNASKCQNTTIDSLNQNQFVNEDDKQEFVESQEEGSPKNYVEKQNQQSTKNNGSNCRKIKQFKVLRFLGKAEVFEVVRYIDSGSFGDVFLVKHVLTKMIFCLKSIRKSHFKDEESLNQLVRQIKIQSSLNHPNIIKVYGYTADRNNIYILMEPCLGKNLFKVMNGQPLNQALVRSYVQQICTAVNYLHSQNILHRDIKPENILVDGDVVKLCDFGWAVYSPLLRSTRCGTPLYTPPEMIRMEEYDSKVDIWCIGMLTYELLYGSIPFNIQSLSDLPKIVNDEIHFPSKSNITREAESFIRSCMKKTSEERFSIKQALQHDFLQKMKSQFRHTFA